MPDSMKAHWNKKFDSSPLTQLGWYEARSTPSIQLVEACGVAHEALIADVGSGATSLIANLLELGYNNLLAIDISEVALEKARGLLTSQQAARVRWMCEDVTDPSAALQGEKIAVWHDRAAFHFLNEEPERQTYRSLAHKTIMPGGFLIVAAFALEGATHCSGLPVHRYSAASLEEYFGEWFQLVESLDYIYTMPSGDLRPYVYARFQKI